jgi:SAM-dependent methyltransferase
MKPLLTRISERVFPRGPLRYLPPDALFGHPPIGSDSNNRLGPISHCITQRRGVYWGKNVLDLGSNAGHFPLLYSLTGARHITAVEPRRCFRKWFDTSLRVFWPGPCEKIQWRTSDIRNLNLFSDYDVISCLGLIYHVPDAWCHLNRIVCDSGAKILLLETQLFPAAKSDEAVELSIVSTMTCNGYAQRVPRPTIKSVEAAIKSYGWRGELVLSDWPDDGQSRGLWVVETNFST